ncbi:type II toxin-antitoxin system Phd/YefM family antitoxin [Tistrella mobilis]|uniref:type II toxin-antitoxin system Phd/YefM family antitoxin n=1 Tax=Tistrella mobilis TaxID=171437 RepID=UPI0005A27E75|nr:type II toxin-antitoxin system Phd/YefM family antitoxin [Tistrella mobilis]
MRIVSQCDFAERLEEICDEVADGGELVLVRRSDGREPVVILSRGSWVGLIETLHLLRSPRNAERLHRGMADARAGRIYDRDLDDGAG